MSLANSAVLVQMTISQWTARKYDRKASNTVANAHGVSSQVGRYNKALMPGTQSLAQIHALSGAIRNKYLANTLPWGIEGTRILPSENYITFMNELSKDISDWKSLVSAFVSSYPLLKVQAQRDLGSLYSDADYPPVNTIREKFNIDVAVFPVPSTDFRVAIQSEEIERIKADVERRVQTAQVEAVKELWDRLYKRVEALHERIADPSNTFRNSTLENLQETCDLLTRMNFSNDPQLEAMRKEVSDALAKHHPDTLRLDLTVRRETANKAEEIMRRMRGYMGA